MFKLLDIVEVVEPIGSNEWCRVAFQFNNYTKDKCRFYRDKKSLRNKFDRLDNMKKPTDDPSWPEIVRHSKKIARDILSRLYVVSVGDKTLDEIEEVWYLFFGTLVS